jgi:hypothetical protein
MQPRRRQGDPQNRILIDRAEQGDAWRDSSKIPIRCRAKAQAIAPIWDYALRKRFAPRLVPVGRILYGSDSLRLSSRKI